MKTLFALLLVVCTLNARADFADTRFLAFGDWGKGTTAQKQVARAMVEHCKEARCDFAIGLGDNFYPAGVKSVEDPYWEELYQKIYGPLKLVFYPSLGNHDYDGNPQAQVEYTNTNKPKNWMMPARFFSFQKKHVDFFVIDTNNFTGGQADWLSKGLKGSTAPWKIVYGHHPIYSYGAHGHNKPLEKSLLPVLNQGKADFYVAGHDHDQQVFKPQGGTHLIVSGAAAENRGVKMGSKAIWVSSELGFGYFTVTNDQLTFQAVNADTQIKFEKSYPVSTRLKAQ